MPGPLPNPERRRRNAPTIPTTNLPASGRPGPVPRPPRWVGLGAAGRAWWKWAWSTPQAAAWSAGDEVAIARRAGLEDLLQLEDGADARLKVAREMRELDDRLGLTPKGMAALRWKIVDDSEPQVVAPAPGVSSLDDRRARILAAGAS